MKEEKLNKGTVNSDPFLCGGKVMLSQWTCCYCNTNKTNDGEIWMLKPICEECLEVKKEEKRMSVMRFYFKGERFVSETDFLKVVKEKENLEKVNGKQLKRILELEKELEESIKISNYNYESYEMEIREKDKKIERLKEKLSCLEFNGKRKLKIKDNVLQEVKKQRNNYKKEIEKNKYAIIENCDLRKKINEKDREIERLKNLYEPEKKYEEWCELSYTYSVDDTTKNVIQNMLLEDAFELIGMDSDNWVGFNVEKYKKEVK